MKKKEFLALAGDVARVQEVVDMSEYLKSAYYWHDNGKASVRAYKERKYQAEHEWDEDGHHYEAAIWTRITYKHCYVYRDYRKDGVATNLTAIKSSLKRMLAVYEPEKAKRYAREARKALKAAAIA